MQWVDNYTITTITTIQTLMLRSICVRESELLMVIVGGKIACHP